MAAGTISVNDSGSKLIRTNTRVVGGSTVHEEFGLLADPADAGYVCNGGLDSIATANSHVLQLLAGGSLAVQLRRVLVYQSIAATTAALCLFDLWSVTTAGTGGTASTPFRLDNNDAASGAAGMILPTVKGTESRRLWRGAAMMMQTVPAAGGPLQLFDLNFDQPHIKPVVIPAGATGGVVFKNLTAIAAAGITVNMYFTEY